MPMMVMRKLTLMEATCATLMAQPMTTAHTNTMMRLTHTSRSPLAYARQWPTENSSITTQHRRRKACVQLECSRCDAF